MSSTSSMRRPALLAALAAAAVAAVTLYPTAADNSVSSRTVASGTEMKDVRTVNVGGITVKRTQQFIQDIPVYGGELISLGDAETLGEVARESKGAFPAKAAAGEKVWFDPSLFGQAGTGAVPAYKVESEEDTKIVDAGSGKTLLTVGKHQHAVNRAVCDANNTDVVASLEKAACGTAFKVLRSDKNNVSSSIPDVNNVFKFFGDAQNFYQNELKYDLSQNIGADYSDGLGKALRGTTHVCATGLADGCPMENAFWDGTQMVFGQGVTTEDITGHELTHGVTQNTSNLTYAAESGALNEGLSDIFGAFINQTAGATGAAKWQIGAGSTLGVIRDMANPGAHRQPDTYLGANWGQTTNTTPAGDYGSVHTNSGVANKIAFLITDGQTFGGQTVKGIGLKKSSQLFWLVQNSLTASSGYLAFGKALNTACKQLTTAGTVTADDCTQVGNAVKAVKIG
ncbi:M4 family peptidase [Pseudonocardiaceae bacterium YIM PH 21723]|nr:M4 family peptidase [Pseudonocardiaceae bacterium YIM PH 21723]